MGWALGPILPEGRRLPEPRVRRGPGPSPFFTFGPPAHLNSLDRIARNLDVVVG